MATLGPWPAPRPNFANRTMWKRDNRDVLRGPNSQCIDLVHADRPELPARLHAFGMQAA